MRNLCFFVLFLLACLPGDRACASPSLPPPLTGVELFKRLSPSVVFIVSETHGLGSGCVVGHNLILTNWHVVEAGAPFYVAFKADAKSVRVDLSDVVIGEVIKVDRNKDLALMRVRAIPKNILPIALGTEDEVEIGAEVHAIGHPKGEVWSYTKGIVSQVRPEYVWISENGVNHNATLIQTQTPINPGNSGGPLISAHGRLIGINTLTMRDTEGISFAIAINEIRDFLGDIAVVIPPVQEDKHAIFSGRNRENTGDLRIYAPKGVKHPSRTAFFYPDDKTKPAISYYDANNDGRPEIYFFDLKQDGWWDISFFIPEGQTRPQITGVHDDGQRIPTRYVPYREVPELKQYMTAFPKPYTEVRPLFDCQRNTSAVAVAVCTNASLMSQAEDIAEQLDILAKKGGPRAFIVAEGQTSWLNSLERECRGDQTTPCIARKFAARKVFLQSLVEE